MQPSLVMRNLPIKSLIFALFIAILCSGQIWAQTCKDLFHIRQNQSEYDLRNFIASSSDIENYRKLHEPTLPLYKSDIWPKDWSEVSIGRGYPALFARSILTYEEYRALNEMTKVGEANQYKINSALRSRDKQTLKKYEYDIKLAASALSKLKGYYGMVFRIGSSDPKKNEIYKVGYIVQERAFTSTSADPEYLSREHSGKNIMFIIKSNGGGRLIQDLSNVAYGENEVMFPPGSVFRVLERKQSSEYLGSDLVTMEEVFSE